MLEHMRIAETPGVVHHDQCANGMRFLAKGRDLLNLHRVRSGRFQHHHASPGIQRREVVGIGATEADRYAHPLQRGHAELAQWAVHAIDDQHMVAGFQQRQHGVGERGEARGKQDHTLPTFDARHPFLKRASGRCRVEAVREPVEKL